MLRLAISFSHQPLTLEGVVDYGLFLALVVTLVALSRVQSFRERRQRKLERSLADADRGEWKAGSDTLPGG